jgi:FKBP-type peptidyl-prolyl cis-trans isomerase SlyD
MLIAKDSVVTISYVLVDIEGNILEKSEPAMTYLHGGHEGIFPLVEEALQGRSVGDECVVRLEPDEAFGEYDAELVRVESRKSFPSDVSVGMVFEGAPDDAGEDDDDFILYRVTDVEGDEVVVDGNHPLAGRALNFKCTVLDVRAATEEELEHGHVHGEHGHHH